MDSQVKVAGRLDGTYRAWCPALPGCTVYSSSRCEALARIRQAVLGYLEHLDVALPRELATQTGRVRVAGPRARRRLCPRTTG